MTTAYIAHFYPDIDAPTHFQVGSVIQVLAPVFGSYSEAARQLAEDIDDIDEAELPVSAYIIEAEPVAGGYEILDVYAVVDDRPKKTRTRNSGYPQTRERTANARRASTTNTTPETPAKSAEEKIDIYPQPDYSKLKPIGETVKAEGVPRAVIDALGSSRLAKVNAPLDINVLDKAGYVEVNKAAAYYGEFMAKKAPKGISARKITGEFNKNLRGAAENKHLKDLAEARKEGRSNLFQTLKKDVKSAESNVFLLIDKMKEADGIIREKRREQNDLDPKTDAAAYKALAQEISRQNKRYEILGYLVAYCPLCAGHYGENIDLDTIRADNLKRLADELNLPAPFDVDAPNLRSKQQAMQKKAENKAKVGQPKQGAPLPYFSPYLTDQRSPAAQRQPMSPTTGVVSDAMNASGAAPPGVVSSFNTETPAPSAAPPSDAPRRAQAASTDSLFVRAFSDLTEGDLLPLNTQVQGLARAMTGRTTWDTRLTAIIDTLQSMKDAYSGYTLQNGEPASEYIDTYIFGDLQGPGNRLVQGVTTLAADKKPSNALWRNAVSDKFEHTLAVMAELPFGQTTLLNRYSSEANIVPTPPNAEPAQAPAQPPVPVPATEPAPTPAVGRGSAKRGLV